MQNSNTKSPRLYSPVALKANMPVEIASPDQAHYLKNVLRKNAGDVVRVFNGNDGEWLCTIENLNKKAIIIFPLEQIKIQTSLKREIHAYFAPIKKNRMDFMIEKAVELGVTHLHPVLTQNTETRKINEERVKAQIIEAAEQCERLDIPQLLPLTPLDKALAKRSETIYAAIERGDYPLAHTVLDSQGHIAMLIGPEGGFTQDEIAALLKNPNIKGVSLGENILRAETALLKMLSLV